MEYRQLGDSGLEVSTVSLGSWLTYGGAVDADIAQACVRRALDLGVNLIDTANAYATGGAESFLGDQLHGVRFTSSQPMYNALWRRPERKLIPMCAANGIGQIVFSPLGQGVLTGKYRPGRPPPSDSRAANDEMNEAIGFLTTDAILEAVQRFRVVADETGLTPAQLALAWVLREPNVSSAITGATRPSQVEENVAASGIVLDDDTVQAIDDALGEAVM